MFENGKEIVQQLLLHGKLKAFNALSRSDRPSTHKIKLSQENVRIISIQSTASEKPALLSEMLLFYHQLALHFWKKLIDFPLQQ